MQQREARGGTLVPGGGFAGGYGWTTALCFRRDIAELSSLGHPRKPGE